MRFVATAAKETKEETDIAVMALESQHQFSYQQQQRRWRRRQQSLIEPPACEEQITPMTAMAATRARTITDSIMATKDITHVMENINNNNNNNNDNDNGDDDDNATRELGESRQQHKVVSRASESGACTTSGQVDCSRHQSDDCKLAATSGCASNQERHNNQHQQQPLATAARRQLARWTAVYKPSVASGNTRNSESDELQSNNCNNPNANSNSNSFSEVSVQDRHETACEQVPAATRRTPKQTLESLCKIQSTSPESPTASATHSSKINLSSRPVQNTSHGSAACLFSANCADCMKIISKKISAKSRTATAKASNRGSRSDEIEGQREEVQKMNMSKLKSLMRLGGGGGQRLEANNKRQSTAKTTTPMTSNESCPLERLQVTCCTNSSCCQAASMSTRNGAQLAPELAADHQQRQVAASSECLKCQLIARWTHSQAELVAKSQVSGQTCSPSSPTTSSASDRDDKSGSGSCSDSDRLEAHRGDEGLEAHERAAQDQDANWVSRSLSSGELAPSSTAWHLRRRRRKCPADKPDFVPSPAAAASSDQPHQQQAIVSNTKTAAWGRTAPKRRPAPMPPVCPTTGSVANNQCRRSVSVPRLNSDGAANKFKSSGETGASSARALAALSSRLLSEQEVFSIEHCLKSHKSSLYVCGCMANLYFTKTHLADNGRSSKVGATNEWRLNKTGVPVLIFDSGLAKNRAKKRLSISLVERGSGFVLWSDTIDHLSNYRAYNAKLDSLTTTTESDCDGDDGEGDGDNRGKRGNNQALAKQSGARSTLAEGATSGSAVAQDSCDTFHVMYLSSNHRILVGLSFDEPTCAQLFLAQIELVCSDPANIALTGPKLKCKAKQRAHHHTSSSCVGGKLALTSSSSSRSHPLKFGALFANLRTKPPLRDTPRNGSPAPPSQEQQTTCRSTAQPSSWSTLKRAALRKFAASQTASGASGGGRLPSSAGALHAAAGFSGEDPTSQFILTTFKPRPLPQLAALGKTWQHRCHQSAGAGGSAQQATKTSSSATSGAADKLGRLAGRSRSRRPGKLWLKARQGSGKRSLPMPRKCDISAPCLFQHVTSVDSATLNELYSRSFVNVAPPAACLDEPPVKQQQKQQQQHRVESPDDCATRRLSLVSEQAIEAPAAAEKKQVTGSQRQQSKATKSPSLSSSSSCYSSASISPTSSECGATSNSLCRYNSTLLSSSDNSTTSTGTTSNGCKLPPGIGAAGAHQQQQSSQQQRGRQMSKSPGGLAVRRAATRLASCYAPTPRPPVPPPKPPQRGASWTQPSVQQAAPSDQEVAPSGAPESSEPQAEFAQSVHQAASATGNNNNSGSKISSIIKELQANAPRNLVDLKQRLMADIADQVMLARNKRAQFQAGAGPNRPTSLSSSSSTFKANRPSDHRTQELSASNQVDRGNVRVPLAKLGHTNCRPEMMNSQASVSHL